MAGEKNSRKIYSLFQSAGVRNFAKLLSANVVAQAIGLAVYPVLTRLYAPDDFGLLNLFLSIGGVLVILATAEYQYAIVLPKDDKRARAVFHVGLFVLLCVVLLTGLSVVFSHPIARLFNTPDLGMWYWLMPLYVGASGLWVLLNYHYTRQRQFGRISRYQLSQSVLNAGAKISFGFAGVLQGGLIISSVLAPLLSVIASVAAAWKRGLRGLFSRPDKSECRIAAREYANFPKYSLPRALVNNLSGALPSLLLTPFFGLANLGFWGMAMTLAFRPLNMISQSLYQVLFENTAQRVNQRMTIRPTIMRFVCLTLLVAVPCFVALYFVLPLLTRWLLGAEWEITGHYIRVMLPWLLLSVLVAPICFLSDIFQQQKIGLYLEVLLIVLRLLGLGIGVWRHSFFYAIAGYSIAGAIVIGIQLAWYLSLVRHYERGLHTD